MRSEESAKVRTNFIYYFDLLKDIYCQQLVGIHVIQAHNYRLKYTCNKNTVNMRKREKNTKIY